jgi:hypothetical protein
MNTMRELIVIVSVAILTLGCGGSSKSERDTEQDDGVEVDDGVDVRDDGVDVPDDGRDVPDDGVVDTPDDGVDLPDEGGEIPDDGVDLPDDADTDTMCPPGTGDCNGDPSDGCETDTTSDPGHCGRCGHDCDGGACVASACQPVHVADPLGTSTGPWNGFLAVGPTYVYYGYAANPTGGVAMSAKDGSSSSCIECDVGMPRELATGSAAVFWANVGTNELKSAPLGGGTVSTLWGSGTMGTPVAVDSSHVYWYNDGGNAVMQANLDGSSPSNVATGQPNVNSIAAHSGYLFWISGGNLMEIDLSGGSPNTLASGMTHPKSVAADATHVYWATGDWDVANNELRRIPRGGGTTEVLATSFVWAIVLDATHVYAADNYGGDIWRVPKAGGTVEVLASGQPYPFDIDVDNVAVYWSSETDGGVGKVAK